MSVIERHVQYKMKSFETYREWEKDWEEIETRLGGFPPKRRMSILAGPDYVGTMVWERECKNLAEYEAANDRLFADAESQRLVSRYGSVFEGERVELYSVEALN